MTIIEKEAVRLFAVYGQPSAVFKKLKEQFNDDCPTAGAVAKLRERFKADILAERKKMQTKIPIMDPEERWYMLQTIYDDAMVGDTMMDRSGNTYVRQDRTTALNAVKVAHDLSQTHGAVHDENDDYIRSIVHDAFKEMKEHAPKRGNSDILNEILANLGEQTRPYVEELRELNATESQA